MRKKSRLKKSALKRVWNPRRPTIKGLQAEINTLRELRSSDGQRINEQHKELERLRSGIAGAQAEVDRLRKDNQWLKQLVQNISEALFNRSR